MKCESKITNKMVAITTIVLSLAYFISCTACRKSNKLDKCGEQTDSVDTFVPTHPPIVIPHTWKEAMGKD